MKIDPKIKQELEHYLQDQLHNQKQFVTIVSAIPLQQAEQIELIKAFPQFKDMKLIYTTDPTLLAGVVIKFGTKMIDLSLKSELQSLKQLIYESA